jgi:hypothetical protein
MNKPGIKIKKLPRIKAKPRTSETVKSENKTRNSTKTAESHKDTFKRRKKEDQNRQGFRTRSDTMSV